MATQPIPGSLPAPTQDERTMAFLAHLLQVFTGFIAPLVIYCVKQDSRFVKFHALQSLVWQLCYMALFFIGFTLAFGFMMTSIFHAAQGGSHTQDPPAASSFSFRFCGFLACSAGWQTSFSVSYTVSKPIAANGPRFQSSGTGFFRKSTP